MRRGEGRLGRRNGEKCGGTGRGAGGGRKGRGEEGKQKEGMKRKRRRDTGEEEYSISLEAGPLDLHSGRDIYTESQRSGRELPAGLSCILELRIQRGAGPKHLKLRLGWGRSGHSFLLGFSLSMTSVLLLPSRLALTPATLWASK